MEWCRGILDDPTVRTEARAILRDANHPAFATVFKTVAELALTRPSPASRSLAKALEGLDWGIDA